MSERVFEIEYHPGEEVVLRFKVPRFSQVAGGHFGVARKEVLLGLRSLLDKAIERAEKAEKTKAKEKTKIEVQ